MCVWGGASGGSCLPLWLLLLPILLYTMPSSAVCRVCTLGVGADRILDGPESKTLIDIDFVGGSDEMPMFSGLLM